MVRPFGFAGRRSHSRAWSPANIEGTTLRVAHERHAGVLRKTPDTGEVNASAAATSRQVGVDLIDGLAIETSIGHGLVVGAREADQSDTRTAAPSITQGSSLHASKIRRFSVAACSARRFAPPRGGLDSVPTMCAI